MSELSCDTPFSLFIGRNETHHLIRSHPMRVYQIGVYQIEYIKIFLKGYCCLSANHCCGAFTIGCLSSASTISNHNA